MRRSWLVIGVVAVVGKTLRSQRIESYWKNIVPAAKDSAKAGSHGGLVSYIKRLLMLPARGGAVHSQPGGGIS